MEDSAGEQYCAKSGPSRDQVEDILAMTIPEKPTNSRQQYCLTEKGQRLLADIRQIS